MPKLTGRSLTMAFCRSVRADLHGTGAERSEYPDLDVRGLALRVSADGAKSWSYRYRHSISGRQCRMTLGAFDPTSDTGPDEGGVRRLTLQGARIAARKLRAQVDAGADPALELRRKRDLARQEEIKTMRDLADAYFKACETGAHRGGRRRMKAPRTQQMERWIWSKYLATRLDRDPPEAITRGRIRQLLRDLLEQAGGQSNKARSLLSQMFNFAISEERLDGNPVMHVPRMAIDPVRTRTLSDEELKRLWHGLQDSDDFIIHRRGKDEPVQISRGVRLTIALAMVTLQRRAEITGMKRRELDLARKTWLIPEERTKGRTEHLVPLSDLAVALIKEALALQDDRKKGPSEFVFPSPHTNDLAIEPGAASHAMADMIAALKLQDVRLHDLRRTGATGIAALGVPPFVVSKVLAHKDGAGGAAITARHYNLYAYANEKREALDRWADWLEQLFGLPPSNPIKQFPAAANDTDDRPGDWHRRHADQTSSA